MAKAVSYLGHVYDNRPSVKASLELVVVPFAVVATLFTLGIVLGALAHSPGSGVKPTDATLFGVEDPTWLTFAKNNLFVLAVLVSGTVLLGLPTFVTTIINGVLLGIIIADISAQGVGVVGMSLLLLPHGIVEVPALLLAAAVGLAIPRGLVAYFRGQRDQILSVTELAAYLQLVVIAIAMITAAAWVEANVTVQLYESWVGV